MVSFGATGAIARPIAIWAVVRAIGTGLSQAPLTIRRLVELALLIWAVSIRASYVLVPVAAADAKQTMT